MTTDAIDLTSPADKTRPARLVTLVEQMLDLHRQLGTAAGGADAAPAV